MADAVDTSRTYVATGSKVLRWGLAAAALFVVAAGVLVAVQGGDATARGVGWAMAAVGVLGAVFALRWAREPLTEMVTISPLGIRDVRVSAGPLPWSAVTGHKIWKMKNSTCVVLSVAPAAEPALGYTRAARWTRTANSLVGARGYVVNTTDCSLTEAEIMRLVEAFRARYGTP